MSIDLNIIKTDIYRKTELFNRMATGYDDLSSDLERSEVFPFVDWSISPLKNDDRAAFVHGIFFEAEVLIDTPTFSWRGRCTFPRPREKGDYGDLYNMSRRSISKFIAEVAVTSASYELFGFSITEEFLYEAAYDDKRRLVHCDKMRIFISDLTYQLAYGDRFEKIYVEDDEDEEEDY